MIEQLASAKLSHIVQGMFQSILIEVHIKHNNVQVGRNDHIRIDRQVFMVKQ